LKRFTTLKVRVPNAAITIFLSSTQIRQTSLLTTNWRSNWVLWTKWCSLSLSWV